MKISTNDFGNYSNRVNKPVQQHNNSAAIQKQVTGTSTAVQKEKLGTVTNEEKKFFAGLYPENKTDVMNYHFYHKNGKMQGVTLGTIFDKRG